MKTRRHISGDFCVNMFSVRTKVSLLFCKIFRTQHYEIVEMIEGRSKIMRAIKIMSLLRTWRVKSSEGYEDYAGHY